VILAFAIGLGVAGLAGPAGADSSNAAAAACKGKKLKNVAGGLLNKNKKKSVQVDCVLAGSNLSNVAGAEASYVMTIPNTRTGQCTLTSYNDSNVVLQTVTGNAHTGPNGGFSFADSIPVSQSDGSGVFAGYYILSCLLPAKATLHTVDLNEP
jgi:hypothetical protein